MTRHKRRLLINIAEATAGILVVVNAALYLALVRPLKSMRASAERETAATRFRVKATKERADRLEQYRVDVPRSESEVKDFIAEHIPGRRQGFSHAARLMRKMSEDSKVRLTGVSYKLLGAGDAPLAHMALEFDVEGAFADMLRFIHTLETTGDFLEVRSFSFSPGETRSIGMHVGANLYLKP